MKTFNGTIPSSNFATIMMRFYHWHIQGYVTKFCVVFRFANHGLIWTNIVWFLIFCIHFPAWRFQKFWVTCACCFEETSWTLPYTGSKKTEEGGIFQGPWRFGEFLSIRWDFSCKFKAIGSRGLKKSAWVWMCVNFVESSRSAMSVMSYGSYRDKEKL